MGCVQVLASTGVMNILYMSFGEHMYTFLLHTRICLGVQLLGHRVCIHSALAEKKKSPKQLHQFTLSSAGEFQYSNILTYKISLNGYIAFHYMAMPYFTCFPQFGDS